MNQAPTNYSSPYKLFKPLRINHVLRGESPPAEDGLTKMEPMPSSAENSEEAHRGITYSWIATA